MERVTSRKAKRQGQQIFIERRRVNPKANNKFRFTAKSNPDTPAANLRKNSHEDDSKCNVGAKQQSTHLTPLDAPQRPVVDRRGSHHGCRHRTGRGESLTMKQRSCAPELAPHNMGYSMFDDKNSHMRMRNAR